MKRALFLSVFAVGAALAFSGSFVVAQESAAKKAAPPEKHDHKDEHKGEKKDLGKKMVAGYTVQVTQVGDVKAGEEAVFVLTLSGGTAKPKAVRGWVGVESGEKSIKSKAEDEEKEYHLHHPVSKPVPAKSQLWIELETASAKPKVAFDYKP